MRQFATRFTKWVADNGTRSTDNPRERQHLEEAPGRKSWWRCIPLDDAVKHLDALEQIRGSWPAGTESGEEFARRLQARADRALATPLVHEEHHGNHEGYACGFSGPHCWGCNEPWPCRASRRETT